MSYQPTLNPQPVTGPLTNSEMRASDVGVLVNNSSPIETREVEHQEVHEGEMFSFTEDLVSLGTGGAIYKIVPASKQVHIIMRLVSAGKCRIHLHENPTTSANGTAQALVNRNRDSANVTGISVFKGPTVSANGTLLMTDLVGSSGTAGGGSRGAVEWILKPGDTYLLRVVPAQGTTDTLIDLNWYEH